MFTKSIPDRALSRAEWLLALGFPALGRSRFEEVPAKAGGTPAHRALELRLMKADGRWEAGLASANRVNPKDPFILRKAAARFMIGYGLHQLSQGNGSDAARLVASARTLWPEGKVDALSLGVDPIPHPAGRLAERIRPLPQTRGWQSIREASQETGPVLGVLLAGRRNRRVRYHAVRPRPYRARLAHALTSLRSVTQQQLAALEALEAGRRAKTAAIQIQNKIENWITGFFRPGKLALQPAFARPQIMSRPAPQWRNLTRLSSPPDRRAGAVG